MFQQVWKLHSLVPIKLLPLSTIKMEKLLVIDHWAVPNTIPTRYSNRRKMIFKFKMRTATINWGINSIKVRCHQRTRKTIGTLMWVRTAQSWGWKLPKLQIIAFRDIWTMLIRKEKTISPETGSTSHLNPFILTLSRSRRVVNLLGRSLAI